MHHCGDNRGAASLWNSFLAVFDLYEEKVLQSTYCSKKCPVSILGTIKCCNKYQQNGATWEIFTGFPSPCVWYHKQPIRKIYH